MHQITHNYSANNTTTPCVIPPLPNFSQKFRSSASTISPPDFRMHKHKKFTLN